MTLRVGSFCSGIAAPEIAWRSLGWQPQWFSEIEPFACAVLAHHFPGVPNLGDMERVDGEALRGTVDVVCAGTPCQSFSVAGLRGGMADPRGNLALVFLRLVDQIRPRWVVWENVPGVLSSVSGEPEGAPPNRVGVGPGEQVVDEVEYDETGDFACFATALGQLGYGWAYRVFDAQYFDLAQRRARVFVVGYLGDWRPATAVLLERHGLSGHPAPSRETGAGIAASLTRGADSSGKGGYAGRRCEDDYNLVGYHETGKGWWSEGAGLRADPGGMPENVVIGSLNANGKAAGSCTQQDAECGMLVTHSLRADGFDASEDGTGRGTPIIPIDMRQASRGATMTNNRADDACSGGAPGTGVGEPGDPAPSVSLSHPPAVAYQCQGTNVGPMGHLRAGNGNETGGVPFVVYSHNGEATQRHAKETDLSAAVDAHGGYSAGQGGTVVSHAHIQVREVRSEADGATGSCSDSQGAGVDDPLPELRPSAFQTRIARNGRGQPEEICPTLQGAGAGATSDMRPCVAFSVQAAHRGVGQGHNTTYIPAPMAVRRLTPRECERLQGFEDDWTLIPYRGKPAKDGPRYRAIGNSMAVPVLRWIGERIAQVEALTDPCRDPYAVQPHALSGPKWLTDLVSPRSAGKGGEGA